MPQPLNVDWDAIKAHALTYGVRAAGRAFGISEHAVKQRSFREGWLKDAGKMALVQPLPESMKRRDVTGVTTASAAARNSINELSEKSRLNLAKAVRKGSASAAQMDGETLLTKADKLKALADTGDKLFGWSAQASTPTLRLELIAGMSGDTPELPPIDVDAVVTRDDVDADSSPELPE